MKFTQQHIPEVKQPEAHVMPENKPTVVKPEKTPETVQPTPEKTQKSGCLWTAYHVLVGLTILGLVVSAYNQGERLDEQSKRLDEQEMRLRALESQNTKLVNWAEQQKKKNTQLNEEIEKNRDTLREMYVWGKTVTQKNQDYSKRIQVLEQKLDEANQKKIRVKIGDQNYTISDMKLHIKEQELQK